MPGWHKQTKSLVKSGKLNVAGIVQEQHPDRAALYMQWQKMDWPVLADPFNDLGISAVPITLLIDQNGIIRYRNPKPKDLQQFLATDYQNQAKTQPIKLLPKEITTLEKLIAQDPKNAPAHFSLGVAYRMRFDSDKRQPSDFSQAILHWQTALDLNPNQYIWRRRIQQYGPRLDKPYSFYDWVTTARQELIARGETPTPLIAEPSGAEFATPSRASKNTATPDKINLKHPDPENKITQDTEGLVTSSTVTVLSTNKKKSAIRVHLKLQPAPNTTWTNDAGNVSFHLPPNSTVQIRDLKIPPLPKTDSSSETRVIEFEIHPKAGDSLPATLSASAFYYVCTKTDHTCRFLRHDIVIPLNK
ncbi:MAG: hypothetical protein ACSHX6_01880 [Akkermansiaceae bacterium]